MWNEEELCGKDDLCPTWLRNWYQVSHMTAQNFDIVPLWLSHFHQIKCISLTNDVIIRPVEANSKHHLRHNDLSTQQAPVVSHRKRVLVSPPINSWFDDGDVDAEDEEEEGGFGFPLFGRTFHIGIPVSIRNVRLLDDVTRRIATGLQEFLYKTGLTNSTISNDHWKKKIEQKSHYFIYISSVFGSNIRQNYQILT